MPSDLPHILVILSDEHCGFAMSHAGDPNVRTPAMDKLAEQGVSFERAYANCPICTPSRGTIFSGRHAHSGPVSGFFDVYKASGPSTATILRELGYHTAYFGKWHCGIVRDQYPPEVRNNRDIYRGTLSRTPEHHRAGFQDWYAFESLNQHFNSYYYHNEDINPTRTPGYETDGLTDLVIDYLANYNRDQPLFIVLSVTPPHFPLIVPDKWKRFDLEMLEVRENFNKLDPFFFSEPVRSDGEMREMLANYYAMVENLDWNIGQLMKEVEKTPDFDNTLTMYIADHGEYMGSHGLFPTKIEHHEESVRIPAIFHWPGKIPAQGLTPGLFSLVDVLPTTLGLIGADIPAHIQGTDFSPALRGEVFAGPEVVLLEMVNNPRWNLRFLDWRGLVTQRWKYAFCETGREQLFDLANDPYEMENLAESQPEQCARLRQLLLHVLDETREPYFHVLIEHGVTPPWPPVDVSKLE
jgi:arylsulfatase A-like enzyme